MDRIGRLLRATALTFAVVAVPETADARSYTLYLATLVDEHSLERAGARPQFDCSDAIYLVVLSDEAPEDVLQAYWKGPGGKERVRASRTFTPAEGMWWAWSGLELNRPPGASLVNLVDPAAGYEPFIGDWHVDVFVDDSLLSRLEFTIVC